MLPCRSPVIGPLLGLVLALGPLAVPAMAQTPSEAGVAPAPQASNAPQPAPMPRPADGAPSATSPAAPVPAPAAAAPVGFAQEFAERLAADDKLAAADREDRAALAKFYESRQHEPVWTIATGLTPAVQTAIAEMLRAGDWGLTASAFQLPTLPAATGADLSRTQRADAEIALSLAVLKYARHARGGRAEPTTLSRNLDRTLPLLDPSQVIDRATQAPDPDAYLRSLHPQHPQFDALRQKYLALKRGQPVAQSHASLPEDEKKSGKKKAPATSETARRLLANMEEWRWMPQSLGDLYVWINVPEFMLRVVKDGKVIHTERVIVGKRETSTPIFSQDLEQVIFHPFWGVPESIKRYDILPSLARGNTRMLARYNLRIQRGGRDVDPESIDWASADIRKFHVYQPPGGGNVLGVVKFRFPNKHDVYMHDTPTKNLFNAPVRTFSHGCVRVREPQRLAELLLAEEKGWPAGRVAAAIKGGPENNQITLGNKVAVHITYFTAMADDAGKLKLFPDIYRHEERIALGIEGKAHLVARLVPEEKPSHADAVGRLSDTTPAGSGRHKKDWADRAFGGAFGNN